MNWPTNTRIVAFTPEKYSKLMENISIKMWVTSPRGQKDKEPPLLYRFFDNCNDWPPVPPLYVDDSYDINLLCPAPILSWICNKTPFYHDSHRYDISLYQVSDFVSDKTSLSLSSVYILLGVSAESSVKRSSKSAKNSTSFEHNTLENMWHDSDSGIPLDRDTFHFFQCEQ